MVVSSGLVPWGVAPLRPYPAPADGSLRCHVDLPLLNDPRAIFQSQAREDQHRLFGYALFHPRVVEFVLSRVPRGLQQGPVRYAAVPFVRSRTRNSQSRPDFGYRQPCGHRQDHADSRMGSSPARPSTDHHLLRGPMLCGSDIKQVAVELYANFGISGGYKKSLKLGRHGEIEALVHLL